MAKLKARLVAQGFSQVHKVNFSKMFTLTMRRKSLQIYLALCLMLNLIIYQVDIVGTYLESLLGDNKLPIFMKLPPRIHQLYKVRKGLLYKLLKSLYSLK